MVTAKYFAFFWTNAFIFMNEYVKSQEHSLWNHSCYSWLLNAVYTAKVNSQRWSDDDEMMIDRSPGPRIIPYSFRIIPSVLLGAQIHRQIYTPLVLLITQLGHCEVNQDRKIQRLPPSAPTWLSKRPGLCKSVYGFANLKEHLFEKSMGFSPVPGFYRHHGLLSSSLHRRELTLAV